MGSDFRINASTAVYADPQLRDLSPVTSLQEGLGEILHFQIAKSESVPASNGIVLRLVPEANLQDVPAGNARKEGYPARSPRGKSRSKQPIPPDLLRGTDSASASGGRRGNIYGD